MRSFSAVLTALPIAIVTQSASAWTLPSKYAFSVQLDFDLGQPVPIGNTTAISGAVTGGTIQGPLLNATVTGGAIQFVTQVQTSGPVVAQQSLILGQTGDGTTFSVSELNVRPVKARVARAEFEIGEPYAYLNDEFIACYSPADDTTNTADCYILGD